MSLKTRKFFCFKVNAFKTTPAYSWSDLNIFVRKLYSIPVINISFFLKNHNVQRIYSPYDFLKILLKSQKYFWISYCM